MASNCISCGCSKISCGCGDSFLTSPAPCPTPADCPAAQPCAEVFDAQCVVYTGTNLECNSYTIVTPNTSVSDALVGIIDYICTQSRVYLVSGGNGVSVSNSVVGNTTTYTVSLLGAMRAQGTPLAMDAITPTAGTTLLNDGVTQIMPEVYDDNNDYNPVTGVWTCPVTGIYDLSFYVHMSNEAIPTVTGFTSGMVIAGIVSTSGYYAVNTMTVGVPVVRYIDITGQALGMNITAGTTLKLNILNLTDVDYIVRNGDVARFVVQRVR